MSDTPDVLEALRVARDKLWEASVACQVRRAPGEVCDGCRQREEASGGLTALAADIKAYRDSPSMANRIALLARCRGEQPTTTPQEPNT